MNEKQTAVDATTAAVRPTKKQRELLGFIESFIAEHGYSPSYREIMNGQHYNSVATVALHVNNLITRGHLRKRDRSARSLEVVEPQGVTLATAKVTSNQVTAGQEKWLIEKVEHNFSQAEDSGTETLAPQLENLQVLLAALNVLGLDGAAQSFAPRLSELKKRSLGAAGADR